MNENIVYLHAKRHPEKSKKGSAAADLWRKAGLLLALPRKLMDNIFDVNRELRRSSLSTKPAYKRRALSR